VYDPLLHDQGRLSVVAVLAALPDRDALSITRLQNMARLAPASLAMCLRELDRAGYIQMATAAVALTRDGQLALDRYSAALRRKLPADAHVSDADRDAAAAALAEHYAQGRLTLAELDARLGAVLTATTYEELSRPARDLP
jgi:hypothetical protein